MKSPACQKDWHTLPKRLWLQTQLRLDEPASDEATIPWLLPMRKVKTLHIMLRPSVMLRPKSMVE
jgi:hypothetical protein